MNIAKSIAITMLEDGMGKTLTINDLEIESILQQQKQRAFQILQENRKQWEEIQTLLEIKGELYGEELSEIVAGTYHNKSTKNRNGIIESIKNMFSSSSTHNEELMQILPPKKTPSTKNLQPAAHEHKPIPAPKKQNIYDDAFIEKVAKTLEIDKNKIRHIDDYSDGGIIINFKPSFNEISDRTHMKEKSKYLSQNDVEHFLFFEQSELIIRGIGKEDFLKLINR